ncbi:hypothetical protein PINS_up006161 [Pythium insidiosum]|nr:hypothetical protein PINS_up006161 [Pythium insidiosum]
MPYHILTTGGIAAIANAVPVTNAELSEIDGVGRIRMKKYGDAIIDIVKNYLKKHNLTPAPAPPKEQKLSEPTNTSTASSTTTSRFFAPKHCDEFGDDDGFDWEAVDNDLLNQSDSGSRKRQKLR